MLSGLRQTARALLRRPAFTAAALLTVALGVGANTAVFSIVHAVLLDPLPFREPDRLVQVWETHPELHNFQVAHPDFTDWLAAARTVDLAAYTFQSINRITLLGEGDPQQVQATMASGSLFSLMGIEAMLGRVYSAEEDRHGDRVAVIGEDLWRNKFGANPNIVGRQIRLEQLSFTVVGVMPKRQAFPQWADLWMPLSQVDPQLKTVRQFHPLEVVGRLKPGVTVAQAQSELDSIAARLAAEHSDTNRTIGAFAVPLAGQMTGEVRPALLILWTAVGLVLLIVSANLAHLMMARALDRHREVAIRLALGAGRGEILRQILSESLMLAFAGGVLGVAIAAALMPVLKSFAQQRIPRVDNLTLDLPVLFFGLGISALAGLLFGLPAWWQLRNSDLNDVMKSGAVASWSGKRSAGAILMASEVALSVVVLFGAALVVRSFERTLHEDPGIRTANVVSVQVALPTARFDNWTKSQQFFDVQLAPRLKPIPGVETVAAANTAPWSLGPTEHSRFATRFGLTGRTYERGQFPVAQTRWVSEDYFQAVGLPLKRGRLLNFADRTTGGVVIDETLARMYFPGQNPVGMQLVLGVVTPAPNAVDIVGVVGDVREFGLDHAPEPHLYSLVVSPGIVLLVRTSQDPRQAVPAIVAAVRAADPELPVTGVHTLEQLLEASLARQKFILSLLAGFALLAAILAATGIYGVIGYAVSRRSREFGIRSAIGAQPAALLRMVVRESLTVTLPGVAAGIGLSLVLSRFMASLLYKVAPTDPLSCAAAAAAVIAVCACASLIPARRAAATDPTNALREP